MKKKKHILIKDFFMEIRKSRNRYFSILIIIILGVAFFSGVRAASPDMRLSADTYFDESNLMDIRVLSTLGLTDQDVKALGKINGVESATPSYSADVLCRQEDSQPVIHLMAMTDMVNQITVKEGKLPQKANEIFMDEKFMENYEYQVGDTLTFASGDESQKIGDLLSETEFTIVGAGTSPFYMSLERGSCTIGNGTVSGFGVILMDSFTLDAYTEIYLTTKGTDNEICYSDTYKDTIDEVRNNIKKISDEQCEIRYASIKADGQEDIDKAKKEIEDSKKKINDAKEEIADGKKQIEEGKQEISDREKELKEGRQELSKKDDELQDGKNQTASAWDTLDQQTAYLIQQEAVIASSSKQLAAKENEAWAGQKQLEEGKTRIEEGENQLKEAKEQLRVSREQLEAQTEAIDAARQKLPSIQTKLSLLNEQLVQAEEKKEELQSGIGNLKQQLENLQLDSDKNAEMIQQIQDQLAVLEADFATLSGTLEQYAGQKKQLEDAIAQMSQGITAYDEGMEAVSQGEAQAAEKQQELAAAKETLAEKESELNAGWEQIRQAKQQLSDAGAKLAAGKEQLEAARDLLSSKEAKIADGKTQLANAKKTIEDGEKEIEKAKETLQEKEAELSEAEQTFDRESKDAQKKISDGEKKAAAAQEKLDELEVPTWYVLGRDSYQTYVEYEQDAQRIAAIGEVFPAIFFLVAALICLTTMTRMVEENRTQIGTLKALGYGKGAIAAKYLFYAFSASIIGSVIGLVVGQKLLPVVIINAYGILYNNLPVVQSPLHAGYSLSSTLLAVGITTCTAGISCYNELKAAPAALMRPEAPKNGKRILMERFTFLWKHMSFTQKSTARNLFRYKKRFFMTVLGIGGCMGLLMVGFGLKDSIMAIGEKQFGEIRTYSATFNLDEESSQEERNKIFEKLKNDSNVVHAMKAMETSVDAGFGDVVRSSYLVVVPDKEELKGFVTLKERTGNVVYELDDEGVIITEKLAKLLNVSPGDTIYLKEGDTKQVEVKISHVVENYYFHYVYMTSNVYERIYGSEPDYTEIFTVNRDSSKSFEETFSSRYMEEDSVLNITFLSAMEERIADMLTSMDTIIYVIVVAAGMLAFVVLYNLNNINISERRRELATLKVLGFYDMEVSEYVFRENIFLTLIGAVFGVVFGLILHRFVILTAEIDLMMFGRAIKPVSYLYSICLTFLFSIMVNMFMHFRLKKLDMVESMKSVE